MKNLRMALIGPAIILALIAAGCGGGGGNGNPPPSNSYLPMELGNSWDYLMTLAPDIVPVQEGSNQLFDYHETVIGTAALSENTYYLFRSVRDATDEYPERVWQQIRRQDDEAIYARLARSGWEEGDLRSILGVDDLVRIIGLPEERYAFVDGVERAKKLRAEALERVSELRERRKRINQEIGEVRSSSRAAEIASHGGRENGIAPDADDRMRHETVVALEQAREEAERLILEWEEAATALDAWTGRFY